MDGEKIFVVAKGHNSYYRLELLNESDVDKLKAEELKQVFAKVLQYELTPCPFRRPFEVELPETPKKILKPWKPKIKTPTSSEKPPIIVDCAAESSSEQENTDSAGEEHSSQVSVSGDATTAEEADGNIAREEEHIRQTRVFETVAVMDEAEQRTQKVEEFVRQTPVSEDVSVTTRVDGSVFEEEEPSSRAIVRNEIPKINQFDGHFSEEGVGPDQLKTPTRPSRGMRSGVRSVTAPAPLNFSNTSTPDLPNERGLQIPKRDSDAVSIASSVDSFHSFVSFHSPISPLPPSPPYSNPPSPSESNILSLAIDVPRSRQHKRDLSELTVTGSTFPHIQRSEHLAWGDLPNHSSPPLKIPDLMDDGASQTSEVLSEAITPSPNSTLRHRHLPRRRRTLSPMPSPSNLYDPRVHMSDYDLTTALLQKTYSYILVPPIQLVALMLGIASRLASSALHKRSASEGSARRSSGNTGEKLIPKTWGVGGTDKEQKGIADDFDDSWDEDDFGVPLSQAPSSSSRQDLEGEIGASWEVD